MAPNHAGLGRFGFAGAPQSSAAVPKARSALPLVQLDVSSKGSVTPLLSIWNFPFFFSFLFYFFSLFMNALFDKEELSSEPLRLRTQNSKQFVKGLLPAGLALPPALSPPWVNWGQRGARGEGDPLPSSLHPRPAAGWAPAASVAAVPRFAPPGTCLGVFPVLKSPPASRHGDGEVSNASASVTPKRAVGAGKSRGQRRAGRRGVVLEAESSSPCLIYFL